MKRVLTVAVALSVAAACTGRRETFSDPAIPVEVDRGAKFNVAVRVKRGWSHDWVLVDPEALRPLRLEGRRNYFLRQDQDRVGADGVMVWTFAAPEPGDAAIILLYRRRGVVEPPLDSARFRVHVRRW